MGTRVRVGLVGQATAFKLMRVDLTADEDAIRAELVSIAAEKLGRDEWWVLLDEVSE